MVLRRQDELVSSEGQVLRPDLRRDTILGYDLEENNSHEQAREMLAEALPYACTISNTAVSTICL
jgi:hypothetical protein